MSTEPKRTIKGNLVSELILAVFPLNGRLLSVGNQLSSNVGLTSARWQVLGALKDGTRSVAQIGRRMGLARQSVQRSVNIMEKDGLVEFVPNPDHKTSPLVQRTKKGETAYRKVMELQAEWSNGLGEELKVDELKTAVQVLRKLIEKLDNDD